MSKHSEVQDKEFHKGTEALQEIAQEVEEERESGRANLPSDATEDAAGPPLEDEEDAPDDLGEVPVHPPGRPMM